MKLLYSLIFLGSIVNAQKLIVGCREDGLTAKENYNGINCKKRIDNFHLSGYYGGDDAGIADSSTDYSGTTDSSYQADGSTKTDYASEPDASYSGSNEDNYVNPSPVSSDADDFKDIKKNIAPTIKKIVPVIKKIVSETKKKDKSRAKPKSKPRPKPQPKKKILPKKPAKKPTKKPTKKPSKKFTNNRRKPTHLRAS
jgi:hypothetical protein